MNEAEWLTCGDPGPMVNSPLSQKSDRKLRLFACASCRMFWDALSGWQAAVLVAERFADGLATLEELEEAGLPPSHEAPTGLDYLLEPDAINAAYGVANGLATWAELQEQQGVRSERRVDYGPEEVRAAGERVGQAVRREQGDLLRDIVGNPFRPVNLDAAWLLPKVVMLAQSIYDERTFDRLPVLADALEEAGCDNTDILTHLRRDGPHVRGCWVVDLVLDKK
jgi:hypothetical protein